METKELSPKVKCIYEAILSLFVEGADLNNLTVSVITEKAGIGKGTAYEYFTNKEEMIAGALFYSLQELCKKMEERFNQERNFEEKIQIIMDTMREHMQQTSCFLRISHVMQDNSLLSKKMQELLQKNNQEQHLFSGLILRMIEKETGNMALTHPDEFGYLFMTVYSRFVTFGIYLGDETKTHLISTDKMTELLCQDLVNDVKACKKKYN